MTKNNLTKKICLRKNFESFKIDDALKQLDGGDIVVFSTYVWNIRLSLKIAERLSKKSPDSMIVFGGPQVPDKPEIFLRDNPYIDIACMKEGEKAFASLLDNYKEKDWLNVPSIDFLDYNKEYVETKWA